MAWSFAILNLLLGDDRRCALHWWFAVLAGLPCRGHSAQQCLHRRRCSHVARELQALLGAFPHASRPNEATTEDDLVWPVLGALGWSHWLTQQNLSSSGRDNVPDGLLFIDGDAKTTANRHDEEWKRYGFGAAIAARIL